MGNWNKAVFLDRDGVLNREIGDYAYTDNDFQVNNTCIEFLKEVYKRGYLLIVISNQGGIGKGLYTIETVEYLHQKMINEFLSHGVRLTEIYYCTHHPSTSKCICRKPETGLIEKAMARFKINPGQSYFVGDHERDVQAAINAGIIPVKVNANEDLTPYLALIK